MANRIQVLALLNTIKKWYGQSEFNPTPDQMDVWVSLLSDVPAEALDLGWQTHLAGQWSHKPPQPGSIRIPAIDALIGRIPLWSEAWEEVHKAHAGWTPGGETRTVTYSHALIERVVQIMGGPFSIVKASDPNIAQSRFRDIYTDLYARERAKMLMTPDYRAVAAPAKAQALPAPRPALPDYLADMDPTDTREHGLVTAWKAYKAQRGNSGR